MTKTHNHPRAQQSANTLSRWSGRLGVLALCAALGAPIALIATAIMSPDTPAWTHTKNTVLVRYALGSASLSLWVAMLTLVFGVGTAWLVSRTQFPGRAVVSWALVLPLAAPAYVTGYIYADLLDVAGPVQTALRDVTGLSPQAFWFPQVRSFPGAVLVLSLALYPYVYVLARTSFASRSDALMRAAQSLGAGPWSRFWRVALPAAQPAIAGALALVIMETLADFAVTQHYGVPTLAAGVFRAWDGMGDRDTAAKLSAILLLTVLALMTGERVMRRGKTSLSETTAPPGERLALKGWHAWCATAACGSLIVVAIGIPVGVLIAQATSPNAHLPLAEFINLTRHSGFLAAAAASLTVALAWILAQYVRLAPTPSAKAGITIASLGYAVPGLVLAVGLLGPMSQLDRALTTLLRDHLGWQGGLIITGTITLLLYAYVVRFLTVAHAAIASGQSQIPLALDHAARSLGAAPTRVALRIHIPLLTQPITAAWLLVFIDAMRELPATYILRPLNVETLATAVYRMARDERLPDAAWPALCLVAIGVIPALFVSRLNTR